MIHKNGRTTEQQKLHMRAWRAAHPEAGRKWQAKYRKNNKEKCNKSVRAWCKKHPQELKAYRQRRRARHCAAPGKWRKGDIEQLLIAQDGLCALCSRPLDPNYHIDHIKPLARGGTNYPSNLQLTHEICNKSKGARV